MLDKVLGIYAKKSVKLPRISKSYWLSLIYDLRTKVNIPANDEIRIKLASKDDINWLSNHVDAKENVVKSSLNFLKKYEIRSLYFGYYKDEIEPSIFQFVLDNRHNSVYSKMPYGGMYKMQAENTVQVENIYAFREKRRKGLAINFEMSLFALLKSQGKILVRTHIHNTNMPAFLWAKAVDFIPDSWIVKIDIDFRILRRIGSRFYYIDLNNADFESYPLSFFKKH